MEVGQLREERVLFRRTFLELCGDELGRTERRTEDDDPVRGFWCVRDPGGN